MDQLSAVRARAAFAPLAPHYDTLTGGYVHDAVLDGLERLALAAGLSGRKVLDVACGTGQSFLPLLRRGYDVSGCDLSPEMLAVARRNAPPGVVLFQADVRRLPRVAAYDLVTCLDDALNYLLADADLDAALVSLAGALRPGGVLVFDLNTLASHRDAYGSAFTAEDADVFLCWHGLGLDADRPGEPGTAAVEIFQRVADDGWRREQTVHHQRHWGHDQVLAALERAGFAAVHAYGQHDGANFEREPDELAHNKIVYVARGRRTP
jgi:SAM-dependent methyltransferase